MQKWIDSTNAIGIVSKSGRNGGTFAHSDIAFEFVSWISAEYKLYIIKDYKRLKYDESSRLSLGWNLNREISKMNYRIHTDAIKGNLIPPELTPYQIFMNYASEADVPFESSICGQFFSFNNESGFTFLGYSLDKKFVFFKNPLAPLMPCTLEYLPYL